MRQRFVPHRVIPSNYSRPLGHCPGGGGGGGSMAIILRGRAGTGVDRLIPGTGI